MFPVSASAYAFVHRYRYLMLMLQQDYEGIFTTAKGTPIRRNILLYAP
jgi:hypothetical protein